MSFLSDRIQGCLLGLAVGDAVGTTLEFKPRGTFAPITDMVGGGPFDLEPGQWTDDTSMALCLAHSLVYQKGFDPTDQMNRYCNWWHHGYMSSTGDCFDIGVTVRTALQSYLATKEAFSGSIERHSSGNGSLMRLAPIPIFYASDIDQAIYFAGESSRTTHGSELCIDACRYFASLLVRAIQGEQKQQLLESSTYKPQTGEIQAFADGSYLDKDIDQIKGSGYVVESLEAALWCFANTDDFRQAILLAANLGDDADTTAAICGQIAGACYGLQSIPDTWKKLLTLSQEMLELANSLYNK